MPPRNLHPIAARIASRRSAALEGLEPHPTLFRGLPQMLEAAHAALQGAGAVVQHALAQRESAIREGDLQKLEQSYAAVREVALKLGRAHMRSLSEDVGDALWQVKQTDRHVMESASR